MTEQTGQTGPPEWYTKPPEWLSSLQQRQSPPASGGSYSAGRQDAELLNAVRAMPENVVNALKEAIQGASQQQGAQSAPQQHAQQNAAGAQQAAQSPPSGEQQQQESKPAAARTFADRWFDNSL